MAALALNSATLDPRETNHMKTSEEQIDELKGFWDETQAELRLFASSILPDIEKHFEISERFKTSEVSNVYENPITYTPH